MLGSPVAQLELACNTKDPGLIPGLGRSPGEGNGYPLQNSCLENSMDRGVWQSTAMELQRVRHNWLTLYRTQSVTLPPMAPDKLQCPELAAQLLTFKITFHTAPCGAHLPCPPAFLQAASEGRSLFWSSSLPYILCSLWVYSLPLLTHTHHCQGLRLLQVQCRMASMRENPKSLQVSQRQIYLLRSSFFPFFHYAKCRILVSLQLMQHWIICLET